jgi:hypothetical protein
MKRVIFVILTFATLSLAVAQTKMIAHRSHSGDHDRISLETTDNFGIPSYVPLFVADTATLEKKWIMVSYGEARDSVELARLGFRRMPYDTAYPQPSYKDMRRINHPMTETITKFNLEVDTIANH